MRRASCVTVFGLLSIVSGCANNSRGTGFAERDIGVEDPDLSLTFDLGPPASADLSGGCGLVTCASLHASCGLIGDGCGDVVDCGSCPSGQSCGGGGTPFKCGGIVCVPTTCAALGYDCGPAGDGCGGVINCGSCTAPQSCGGDGVAGRCGSRPGSDAGACTPRTCAAANANCGPVADGCGLLLQCGSCPVGQSCGAGGVASRCGLPPCTPITCAQAGASCGAIGDGCGGVINCGSCTAPQSCGGGGQANQCGLPPCVPKSCAQLGAGCGAVGDGCGNILQCGTCPSGQGCGGGGAPNQCGVAPCTPKTCAQLGATCGAVGDGCGNILQCGTCSSGSCGAGGAPNQCGLPPCTPKTCAQLGAGCGAVGDGCGNILLCGTCASGQSCGGGGLPNTCGMASCTPRTCAQANADCGLVGDGCGNVIDCGSCASPQICGGGGLPNVCGSDLPPDAGSFARCDAGVTSISGTVLAGTDPSLGFGQPDPIYNAVVYVPNGAVPALTAGATCDQCGSSQPAIVSTTSAVDGTFKLLNPPAGNVTVVILLGKWRRVINVNVTPCQDNPLTASQTRLPRKQGELNPLDNIPRFAVDTGNVDVLECVLRKMGVADSEFVNPALDGTGHPTAAGRVQIYQGGYQSNNGAGGAVIGKKSTPAENQLWGSQTTLDAYDAVLFPCEGGEDDETSANQDRVISYANAGGRVFATHFSYVWLYNRAPFSSTASWKINNGSYNQEFTGFIDQTFPKGKALAQWLAGVGASTALGQLPVDVVRNDFTAVVAPSQQWVYAQTPQDPAAFPLHYTFNTPVGAAAQNQCGRVVFSDFHVENSSGSQGVIFPSECNANAPLTPQEKLLEFMLFDLTSCVQPDAPTCTAKSCAQQNFNCGQQGDGCGGTISCGACPTGQWCGGGGTPGQCGGACVPTTCAQQNFNCGQQGDGCGNVISCGACPSGQSCGGGGTPGVCGGGCSAKTCAQQGFNCGQQGDGCGNAINCGACSSGQSCGGGGTPGVCGGGCSAKTCAQQGFTCGQQGDGCGGTLDCGSCPTGQSCGGGGVIGACGGGCTPKTCAQQGFNCGQQGDGCGNLIQCGACTPPQSCGGGGAPGVCGGGCAPLTCAQQNIGCGPAGDGCGGMINCGACPTGQTCGGGGVPGQCGALDMSIPCVPRSCAQQNIMCGPAGDGCGNLIQCGTCTPPQTCGGGGTPGQCGGTTCTPRTCVQAFANCGIIGDGCGGSLDCGTCAPPANCGGLGVPNQCGVLM